MTALTRRASAPFAFSFSPLPLVCSRLTPVTQSIALCRGRRSASRGPRRRSAGAARRGRDGCRHWANDRSRPATTTDDSGRFAFDELADGALRPRRPPARDSPAKREA